MSSLKQIEANRRNALKSTGPTTPEGKRTFALQCRSPRPYGRDGDSRPREFANYETFEAAVIADYTAEIAVERQLVIRLASVLWRLRRATGIETAIFDSATENARLLTSAKSTSAVDRRIRWPTAIYSFQQCRIFHSTALLAMNPLCGGKLGR